MGSSNGTTLNGDDLEEGSAPLPLADGRASRAGPVSSA